MTDTEAKIAAISAWVDRFNGHRDPEALTWSRVTKVTQEAGEAVEAWELYVGGNPRKPAGTLGDVVGELLDAALAALGAVEHLTGNHGLSLVMLAEKVDAVHARAGLDP